MTTIARLLSLLVILLERVKGEQVYVLTKGDPTAVSHLIGQALVDYEIHIYCHRKQYCRIYRRWSWFNRTYVLYNVFSVITGNAPKDIVEACKIEVHIPAQLPSFVEDAFQRRSAVNAYLDLVIARLATP
jgi:hypothetical protein